MRTQFKLLALEMAVKLVTTMPEIKNKQKAALDCADSFVLWLNTPPPPKTT
jgi:hypothetical protein